MKCPPNIKYEYIICLIFGGHFIDFECLLPLNFIYTIDCLYLLILSIEYPTPTNADHLEAFLKVHLSLEFLAYCLSFLY